MSLYITNSSKSLKIPCNTVILWFHNKKSIRDPCLHFWQRALKILGTDFLSDKSDKGILIFLTNPLSLHYMRRLLESIQEQVPVDRGTNYVIRGLELSVPPARPLGKGEGLHIADQSPLANGLINHAHVMKPP